MPNERRSRALFVNADGGPMVFSLVPCPERKEIRELVEHGGGILVQPDKLPDAIRLVPSSVTITDSTDDVFSVNYIRVCSENDTLFRIVDFKIPTAPATVEASDSDKTRRLRSVRTRREYSLGDEITIAKYIASKPGVRVRGNAVYKEMVSACVVPGKHSWQSLKEHYLKKILPLKSLYESPRTTITLSKTRRGEVAGDPSTLPLLFGASDIIVEDSGSEQQSYELQRLSGSSLQDEETPSDVVPETESSSAGTPVASARIHKSKRAAKLSSSASHSVASPEKTLTESSDSAVESLLSNGKDDYDHSTSTSDQASIAVKVRKLTLPTPLEVCHKKQKEPSASRASVRAGSRRSLRKASTGIEDMPGTTGQEPILNERRELRSSLRQCKNITPQKLPTSRRRTKSGTQRPIIDHSTCTAISGDQSVPDVIDKQQTPVKLQPKMPVSPNIATQQESSSSLLGKKLLPQSSDSSILGNALKHTPPTSTRCVSLRRSLRKRPNAAHQELASSHSNSQPSSESSGNIAVMPRETKNSCSPGCCHDSDGDAVADLLEHRPPLHRQDVRRSSPRKQQSAVPQKDSSSHSSTWHYCKSANDAISDTDSEDPLAPFQSGRSLLSCASPARRHMKKGISLHSKQAPDSVSTDEYKCTDPPSRKSNTSPHKQCKTTEVHKDVPHQNMDPSSILIYDAASSSMMPNSGTSAEKRTKRQSSLQIPRHEPCLRASATKTAHRRKKAPKSALICQASSKSPPPKCSEGGHVGSAGQRAGTRKNKLLLVPGADMEDLDSADEALLTEALVQEAALRGYSRAPDVAEEHPVMSTREEHRDDVNKEGASASAVSRPSTVTMSDFGHSANEDSAPESEQDEVSKVQKELIRLLGILRAGKNTEPHERCPADCDCPRSTRYIRTARAAVSFSAFLAYHGERLPSESPGIEDPEMALFLEVLLRRLEGSDENERDSSSSA